jgi:hypothetical protein
MIGNFILRKLLESKLKDLPAEQREKIMQIVEKKPELIQKIAVETKQKMDQGMPQADAMMEVTKKYSAELKEAMD